MEAGVPPVRYAHVGDAVVAYQVAGDGPTDVFFQLGFAGHLEIQWEHPVVARFLRRLASFSRLILFDRRGTGLADRGTGHLFEDVLDDISAVLDAVSSEHCALVGHHSAGRAALLYAATHPDRISAVATIAGHPATYRTDRYPMGTTREEVEALVGFLSAKWGEEVFEEYLRQMAPSVADDPFTRQWFWRFARNASSAAETAAAARGSVGVDIIDLLPSIRVPVLVLHRERDVQVDIGASHFLADRIPGAKMVVVPGVDNIPFFGEQDALLDELEEFLTGTRARAEPDRALATILITDIVGSTDQAADLGDRKWREVLDKHDDLSRRRIEAARGRIVKTTGDGILATFDGPARAIRCAITLRDDLRNLGVETRAGLHTGEVELRGDDIGGIAVHIAARVSALAGAGEVLVSRTVTDLVTGSGFAFSDKGVQPLKGVPGEWQVFEVKS